jgi:hypothetical protein
MKQLPYKTIGVMVVLFGVMLLVYKVTLFWNPIGIRKQTVSFLRAVQEQDYNKAAELFGWEGNKAVGNEANAWKRLFEEEGVRLLSFSNVRAAYDDGCYCTGHADLVFEVDENPMMASAVITYGVGARPKQICAITPSELKNGSIPQLVAWNALACGNRSF